MKLPVALQLYSVREHMEADFLGTLARVKDMGYDGVEFAGLFDRDASEVKNALDKLGLTAVSAHVPYYDMLEDPDSCMSTYALIGCRYIAVPYLTPECRPGTDGFGATIEGIRKIGEAAKKHGMLLLYHNHDFEFIKLGGKYALEVLYDTVPADILATELDTCWVNVGGEEPAAYVEKFSGRAPVVHLKDFVSEGKGGKLYDLIGIDDDSQEESGTFEFRPVGYGCQDFAAIVAASEKAGAEWVVVEQDKPSMGKDELECADMSIRWLRENL